MPENLPAVQGTRELSTDDMSLMLEGSRTGVETFSVKQLMVPYLRIIQGSSDYVKPGTPTYSEAARPGFIMDTLLMQPWRSVDVVPCKYEDHFVQWKKNQTRNALVRQWFTDSSAYDQAAPQSRRNFLGAPRDMADGTEIHMVPTYYCLLVNPDTGMGRPVTLPLGGTQGKKSKRWNGLIDMLTFQQNGEAFNAPIYAQVYRLTTVPESNDRGETWSGWKVEPVCLTLSRPNGRILWQQAQAVRAAVERGEMKMAEPQERDVTADVVVETAPPSRPAPQSSGAPPMDDEIPF